MQEKHKWWLGCLRPPRLRPRHAEHIAYWLLAARLFSVPAIANIKTNKYGLIFEYLQLNNPLAIFKTLRASLLPTNITIPTAFFVARHECLVGGGEGFHVPARALNRCSQVEMWAVPHRTRPSRVLDAVDGGGAKPQDLRLKRE
jgi:hypothetical protein